MGRSTDQTDAPIAAPAPTFIEQITSAPPTARRSEASNPIAGRSTDQTAPGPAEPASAFLQQLRVRLVGLEDVARMAGRSTDQTAPIAADSMPPPLTPTDAVPLRLSDKVKRQASITNEQSRSVKAKAKLSPLQGKAMPRPSTPRPVPKVTTPGTNPRTTGS